MSERFYTNSPLQPGHFEISGPEAHHIATVLRCRSGDVVCLFNGDGADYQAVVHAVTKKHVEFEITGRAAESRERTQRLEVAAPLPKGDRADFLIEKLTELGVARFVPLKTERSVVHPRRLDRLERAVIEASKQCGRNVLMQVGPLTSWGDYIRSPGLPDVRLIAHPGEGTTSIPHGERAVAVGPEGGFANQEVADAVAAGWRCIGLGPRILRVETAAIVMAAGE